MSDYILRDDSVCIADYAADEHPYDKDRTRPETCSEYNRGWNDACDYIREKLETAKPAADVAEVRHGRWECVYDDRTGETDITCSHCKNTRTVNGCFVSTDGASCYFEDDYCPSCGAKMDLDGENG